MRQLQPVVWTKGVLLTPQHLQLQDRYLEDLLRTQLTALAFAPWGFHRVAVDHEALAAGSLALAAAGGIFPDGLLYDAPDADPLPPPRPLDAAWAPDQQALDVFLTVPERRPGGYQVGASSTPRAGATNARYIAEVLPRRDETTGLAERPVQVGRKNVRLLVTGEPLEGSSAMRVARVRRGAAGEYRLDPDVIPPLLDLAASDQVLNVARRLVELLAAKSTALSGRRRQRNLGLAEFGAADVAPFWLLYTVNTALPTLRHLAETRRGHPEPLYAALLALAGALATFAPTAPAPLPPYDHDDLGACLRELDHRVRELLDTAIPVGAVSLPLRLQPRSSTHTTALADERYLAAPQLFLAVRADVGRAELLQRVPQLVKVCSADHIETLIRQALPGVALAHAPSVPGAVPVQLDYEYFSLSRSGPAWEAIRRARNFAAYVPADLPDARLELVIVLPERGERGRLPARGGRRRGRRGRGARRRLMPVQHEVEDERERRQPEHVQDHHERHERPARRGPAGGA